MTQVRKQEELATKSGIAIRRRYRLKGSFRTFLDLRIATISMKEANATRALMVASTAN
jgi:hypothetical protein